MCVGEKPTLVGLNLWCYSNLLARHSVLVIDVDGCSSTNNYCYVALAFDCRSPSYRLLPLLLGVVGGMQLIGPPPRNFQEGKEEEL